RKQKGRSSRRGGSPGQSTAPSANGRVRPKKATGRWRSGPVRRPAGSFGPSGRRKGGPRPAGGAEAGDGRPKKSCTASPTRPPPRRPTPRTRVEPGNPLPRGAGLGRFEDGVDQVGAPLEQFQVTQRLPAEPPGLGRRYQEGFGCLLVDGLGVHPSQPQFLR